MTKKIFLTSILAISFAFPAMAGLNYPNGVGGSTTCDTATLGQSENNSTANVEAVWTPNFYEIKYRCSIDGLFDSDDMYSCSDLATDPESCIDDTHAVYGYDYSFRSYNDLIGCSREGYTFTGWSCTDGNAGSTPTTYSDSQTITWNIDSDLYCTGQWSANTINIDWFSDGARIAQNTCTYDSTITLPTQPTKTGYTFNGWLLHDDCADLNTQNACNMNAQCAWDATNTTCVNLRTCENTSVAECPSQAFCIIKNMLIGQLGQLCSLDIPSVCSAMQSAEQCAQHECVWDETESECSDGSVLSILG